MELYNKQIITEINKLVEEGASFCVATIVDASSGSPGRTGFKLVFTKDEKTLGTVGGGALELSVVEKCKSCFEKKKSSFYEFDLTDDLGMACGGNVKVFIEFFEAIKTAYLFGAGHMGRSLTPLLNSINFKTVVVDNRPEFGNKTNIPEADEITCVDYLEFAEKFTPNKNDAVIIFTHGHTYDYDIMNILCRRNISCKYVGLIGSKTKLTPMKEKIKAFGYEGDLIDMLNGPIGLNIATKTTSEIAIAITAEILAVYNGVTEVDFLKNL